HLLARAVCRVLPHRGHLYLVALFAAPDLGHPGRCAAITAGSPVAFFLCLADDACLVGQDSVWSDLSADTGGVVAGTCTGNVLSDPARRACFYNLGVGYALAKTHLRITHRY